MLTNFDTNTLIAVVPNLKTPSSFLLDKFFPNMVVSNTEEITVDIMKGARRLAPFVHPLVEGKVMENLRTQSNIFKPAYIKDKRTLDPTKALKRAVGEIIGGNMSAEDRERVALEMEMQDQVNCITRNLEHQAAKGLETGKVVIEGEGYNSVQVDFGRDASLTKALTGDAAWDAGAGASPTDDVEDWATAILKKSGVVSTDVVFTPSSWKAFKADPVLENHQFFAGGNEQGNNVRAGAEVQTGGVYKGRWGNFDLWLYNDWFIDSDGVEKPMLTDGSVIMSGKGLQGTRSFATILDPELNYPALPMAPKTWTTHDPAARWLMMQSAPLVIPTHIDASFCAQVIEG